MTVKAELEQIDPAEVRTAAASAIDNSGIQGAARTYLAALLRHGLGQRRNLPTPPRGLNGYALQITEQRASEALVLVQRAIAEQRESTLTATPGARIRGGDWNPER
jgi:hypothetical protein